MTIYVGSYPVRAPSSTLTPGLDALAATTEVAGFEIPWRSRESCLALVDEIRVRAPGRRVIVTDVGWTMDALADDPSVGLASADESGRSRALAEALTLAETVREADAMAPGIVRAVELHSAPVGGDPDALQRSLARLSEEAWAGAELIIEHVDAPRPGRAPAKGFLSLDDEISALTGSRFGIAINWARSAIETRSAEGPLAHIERARRAGRLRALMFSGVADTATDYGPAWKDAHLPFAAHEPASLLTAEHARRDVAAAGAGVLLGVKMAFAGSAADAERMLRDAVACVTAAQSGEEGADGRLTPV